MTDEDIRTALGLDDRWTVRFVGSIEEARAVADRYHGADVPTRLAAHPDARASGTEPVRTATDGGTAAEYVLLVDALSAPPTVTDDHHHELPTDE